MDSGRKNVPDLVALSHKVELVEVDDSELGAGPTNEARDNEELVRVLGRIGGVAGPMHDLGDPRTDLQPARGAVGDRPDGGDPPAGDEEGAAEATLARGRKDAEPSGPQPVELPEMRHDVLESA